ncbi:hypothetical protein QBC43DRAFT_324573 [Cladorrhinum sp. PSN259]|nr:hypothetical protein QBC43DRAFT_324573 [Cladorrhinum sp. PSN259]
MSSNNNKDQGLQALRASTLLLSGLASGISLSYSALLVPRLLEAPVPVMLKQWRSAYAQGKKLVPLLSVFTSLGYWYLAAKSNKFSSHSNSNKLFGTAGALTFGIVPYTLAWMWGVNKELTRREKEVSAMQAEELTAESERSSKQLVDWWGVLNLGRSGMMILGFGLGLAGVFI